MPRTTSITSLRVLLLALPLTAGCVGKRRAGSQGQQAQQAQQTAEGGAKAKPEGQGSVAGTPTQAPADSGSDAKPSDVAAVAAPGERFFVPFAPDAPTKGAKEPLVTIVEFSDFQCPFCGKLAKTLDQVLPAYERDVKLVFKQYPLPSHADAEPAARAALAAQRQGKFWEMHDLIFQNQGALTKNDLNGYARRLGLDMAKFQADIEDRAINERVLSNRADAVERELTTTPSFYVNGKYYKGALSAEEIKGIIDEELAAAKKLVADGTDRSKLYASIMKGAKQPTAERPKFDPTHKRGEASRKANYAMSVEAWNPSRGPKDALVSIVLYGAFDNAGVAKLQPTLTKMREKYGNDVRIVWKNFAGDSPDAQGAARAAQAAHRQGKFWEMHDKLLANQGDLNFENVKKWAEELGLDSEKFVGDIRDAEIKSHLDIDQAVADKIRGTAEVPFLFVNGRFRDSKVTEGDLDSVIAEERQKAQAFIDEKGTPRARLYESMRATWRGLKVVESARGN